MYAAPLWFYAISLCDVKKLLSQPEGFNGDRQVRFQWTENLAVKCRSLFGKWKVVLISAQKSCEPDGLTLGLTVWALVLEAVSAPGSSSIPHLCPLVQNNSVDSIPSLSIPPLLATPDNPTKGKQEEIRGGPS